MMRQISNYREWYGQQATQAVLAHQYAVKMIDEFELPILLLELLPITNEETSLRLY